MTGRQKAKAICDGLIIVCILLMFGTGSMGKAWEEFRILTIFAVICTAAAAIDLLFLWAHRDRDSVRWTGRRQEAAARMQAGELLLLDEQDKPVKSWNIAGMTAVVIGRGGKDEEVDVDLEDSEYGTFIDPQHAALNYCLDGWYIEDLGSTNGVRVQKAEDGICYKQAGRPCRVEAGDILYIANTRLLLN